MNDRVMGNNLLKFNTPVVGKKGKTAGIKEKSEHAVEK